SPAIQTPHSSPEPVPGSAQGQFEEFSLATQLPVLNGYSASYATAEPTPNAMNSTQFQNFEPYSVQYFFTTPPDTPPSIPMLPSSAPANFCSARPNSSKSCDPTPTIRKLLQQKKKRMPAVPCHVNSVCTTCKTRTTSLWRRNHLGEIECNACNLYFRKNNCKRPVTLRKDEIMKRKRKPRIDSEHPADGKTTADFNQIQPEQKVFSFT
ncbi:GATA zinc finger, partial [Oesophagostomum dentatum]